MTNRSKSTLFLIEQLIVIAVFAICAAACISILTAAYFYTNDSKAANHAVLKAESGAEIFKASGGDYGKITELLRGIAGTDINGNSSITVFYNGLWQVSTITEAEYFMIIISEDPQQFANNHTLSTSILTVNKITGEELVSLPLAARVEKEGDEA